jgi:ribosomal protein S18 acetylase RimI-like enzyme
MKNKLILRKIKKSDCEAISKAFQEQGWDDKTTNQYWQYLDFQESGERDIIIAEFDGMCAGYLTIKWKSSYKPFLEKGIPEVVDFNVLKKFQRKGIGNQLMDEAERRIKKISDFAGIGFGVTEDYGAAQILYINRNYKPDGRGLIKNYQTIQHGEVIAINHSIAFYLIKKLR